MLFLIKKICFTVALVSNMVILSVAANINLNKSSDKDLHSKIKLQYQFNLYSKDIFKNTQPHNNHINDSELSLRFLDFVEGTEDLIEIVMQAYVNNQHYQVDKKNNLLSSKYAYLSFGNFSLGKLMVGNIPSNIQYITSILNQPGSYVFNAGVDLNYQKSNSTANATYIANNAVSYISEYDNVFVSVVYQPKSSNNVAILKDTNAQDSNLKTVNFYKKYSTSLVLGYKTPSIYFVLGAQKNYFILNDDNKPYEESGFSNYSSDNINLLGGLSYKTTNFYISAVSGYYKNLYYLNSYYIGHTAYLSYNLNKITPYLGFNFIHKAHKFSLKNNYVLTGLSYNISQNSKLGVEFLNGVGSKNNIAKGGETIYNNREVNIYFSILS